MSWKRSQKWPLAAEQLITLITLDLQFMVSRKMKEYILIVCVISCFAWLELKQLSAVEAIVREAEKHKTATTVLSLTPRPHSLSLSPSLSFSPSLFLNVSAKTCKNTPVCFCSFAATILKHLLF